MDWLTLALWILVRSLAAPNMAQTMEPWQMAVGLWPIFAAEWIGFKLLWRYPP